MNLNIHISINWKLLTTPNQLYSYDNLRQIYSYDNRRLTQNKDPEVQFRAANRKRFINN